MKERIEKGLLDMGLLAEPVDIGRYVFLRMPQKDRWGVLLPKEHPLARKEAVTPNDLLGVPLLISGRETVRNELAGWFGDAYEKIEIAATFNLILNAANMVKNGVGAALCYDFGSLSDALAFVPLSPTLETGTVLAWKKDQACSPAAAALTEVSAEYRRWPLTPIGWRDSGSPPAPARRMCRAGWII